MVISCFLLSIGMKLLNYTSVIYNSIKINESYKILGFTKNFCASIFMLKKTFFYFDWNILCSLWKGSLSNGMENCDQLKKIDFSCFYFMIRWMHLLVIYFISIVNVHDKYKRPINYCIEVKSSSSDESTTKNVNRGKTFT